MKHFTAVYIFFCMATITASAQYTTNIFWTEQTEMSASNTIYYNPSQNLGWQDFKGSPNQPEPIAAITSSGFGYKASMRSLGGKGQINISVYCYFVKDKSWVKPGRTTPYILNHEQHHFDVSYLAAGLFVEKVKNAGLTAANLNSVLPKLYRECCDIMNKMQSDYDGQTKNGQLAEAQAKWNAFFNDKVSLVIR